MLSGGVANDCLVISSPRRGIEEFIQLRREMLRFARSIPAGGLERNQRLADSVVASWPVQEQGLAGRAYVGRSSAAQ